MYATEWSGGGVINLGGLPDLYPNLPTASTTPDRRWESAHGGIEYATEWSGGSVITLGSGKLANSINDAGQAVG